MPGDLPVVHVYVDDAGSTDGDIFIVGMFCTIADRGWREVFQGCLDAGKYTHTLHFSKLGRNPHSGGYRVSRLLLGELAARRDWWGHYMYVDRRLVDNSYFSGSPQIEYNKWVAELVRLRTRELRYQYEVVIAHRDRLRTDNFIPEGLHRELQERSGRGYPRASVTTRLSRDDRMLQLADLLTSAVHQFYRPSGNPIKEELAGLARELVKLPGQSGNRRIYPFELRPRQSADTKKG